MQTVAFVSYSHRDQHWVKYVLLPRLAAWRIEVLLDVTAFQPGEHLVTAIGGALQRADRVLFVVTENFASSEWTRRELQETISADPAALRQKAIPIVLDEAAVPTELRSLIWCRITPDHAGSEFEWSKLCKALNGPWPEATPGVEVRNQPSPNTPPGEPEPLTTGQNTIQVLVDEIAAVARMRLLLTFDSKGAFPGAPLCLFPSLPGSSESQIPRS